jgi:hypothetical protein
MRSDEVRAIVDRRAAEAIRGIPTVIDTSLSHSFDVCRQAGHLTPDRLPTPTPSMEAEVFATTKENGHWPGGGPAWAPIGVKVQSRFTPNAPVALPPLVAAYVEAINSFDLERLMVTFAEDALVNDQLRDYWGKLVITEWAKRDIVGERLTMNVMGPSSLRPMSTATMTSAACLIRWCSPSISAPRAI